MRKLVALGLVIALALFIWKRSASVDKPNVAAEYQYSIADIDRVDAIEIDEPGKPLIVLQRSNGYWTLNEQYKARPNAIENLLTAIQNVELQFIPQEAGVRTILDILEKRGINVKIADRSGKVIKAYQLGGVTPDERGTYIRQEGFIEPAVVSMSGFEGSLIPRFQMSLVDWRDRTVLSASVDEVDTLRMLYPDQSQASFEIVRQTSGDWKVSALHVGEVSGVLQQGLVEAYLRSFRKLGAEDIIRDQILLDEIRSQQPFASVTITTIDGIRQAADFFPIRVLPSAPALAQIDRYHVLDHHDNLFLVQHRVFEEIFRGYQHFMSRN